MIRSALVLLSILLLAGSGISKPLTQEERYQRAIQKLESAKSLIDRFYALNNAAKESFVIGKTNAAQKYAEELLKLLPSFKNNWNYGNAVQDANLVLGRIAVTNGHINKAKRFLIAAGRSPGSPQMDSFGPNMSLAKDLLEHGEKEAVLVYFVLCRKFWKMHFGKLDKWSLTVKNGGIPNFGANLVY